MSTKQPTTHQESTALADRGPVAMTSNGLRPANLEEAWRYATALSRTAFVPDTYRGKPEDCLIAIDTAMRLNVAPLMLLQNTYIVHGRPGMEAKLVVALTNNSGLFTDPLEYEVEGDDPFASGYRVRAYATRSSTGKQLFGPWIDWKTVKGEGWDGKQGSKWKTMPGLMFVYRAAAWFARMHCPEVLMGMQTTEELHDAGERRQIESKEVSGIAAAKERLKSSGHTNEQRKSVDTPQEATDEAQSDATEGAPEATDSGVDAPDWDGPTEDTEFLYWCTQCDQGFDTAKTRKINGQTCTCCPVCGTDAIMAYEDYQAQLASQVDRPSDVSRRRHGSRIEGARR